MQHCEQYDFTVRTPFSNLGVNTEGDTLVGIQLIEDDVDIGPAGPAERRIAATASPPITKTRQSWGSSPPERTNRCR